MALQGRGRNYSRGRHWADWAWSHFYRGGWVRSAASASPSNRVRVSEFRLALSEISPDENLRIVFLSDLHAGPTTGVATLRRALELAGEAKPDVILLGGDYVFLDARYIDEVTALLSSLEAPLGMYAVLGNHDLWADDQRIIASLESVGVQFLINRAVTVGPIDVVGIDDPWTGEPEIDRGYTNVSGARPVIVLCHAPEVIEFLGNHRADAVICGHTHGGHVCLPGGKPVVMFGPISRKYPSGEYEIGEGRRLIVGRGIGNTEVPFRLWAPPEVLVVDVVTG